MTSRDHLLRYFFLYFVCSSWSLGSAEWGVNPELECIARPEAWQILPQEIDEGDQLGFTTVQAWCEYNCDWKIVKTKHHKCDQLCFCSPHDRSLRPLAREVQMFECHDGAAIKLSTSFQSGKLFNGFAYAFTEVYNKIIDTMFSATTSDQVQQEVHCELSLLTSLSEHFHQQNGTQMPVSSPTMINLKRECREAVKKVTNQYNLRVVSQSDQDLIVMVTVNPVEAVAIQELGCVHNMIQLPIVMKLAGFARSISRYVDVHTVHEKVDHLPSVALLLAPEADKRAIISALNKEISSVAGMSTAVYLSERRQAVLLKQMVNMKVWAIALSIIIQHPYVQLIDIVPTYTLSNGALRGDFKGRSLNMDQQSFVADVLEIRTVHDAGITGNDLVVGVTDSGLYVNHDQFRQTSRNIFNEINQSARKVVTYITFADDTDQSETATCGHGTHVAGLAAGSSFSGANPDIGAAPNSKIAFMDVGFSNSCDFAGACQVEIQVPGTVTDLMSEQYRAGTRVFSFSWGSPDAQYAQFALQLDNFLNENPEVLVVMAAGNDGKSAVGSVSSPADAKNVLTVGAAFSDSRTYTNCRSILNEQTIAPFSATGPTSDGRLKPDVVGPGVRIVSASSLPEGSTDNTAATCLLDGTSMATPSISGMALLVREWLRDGYWKNGKKDPEAGMEFIPSALIKAILIHSGSPLQQRLDSFPQSPTSCDDFGSKVSSVSYPDNNQGYGTPRMSRILSLSSMEARMHFYPNAESAQSGFSLKEGATQEFEFVVSPGDALRVTMAYTDLPGNAFSKTFLQNDLDLSAKVDGVDSRTFYPLSGRGSPDRLNNVEMIEIRYSDIEDLSGVQKQDNGQIRVFASVRAHSVDGSQPYSIVSSSQPQNEIISSGAFKFQISGIWLLLSSIVLLELM